MNSNCKFKLSLYIFIIFTAAHLNVEAQNPTPPNPVVIQGRANLGQVQMRTLDDVLLVTGVAAWHEEGWTGDGITIGVIDLGFSELVSFENTHGIEVEVPPSASKIAYSESDNDHGTKVLEIIHSVAPDANLFACSYLTYEQYVLCVDAAINGSVDILNHSAGVPALPLDGTNVWSREVDRATQRDILWINSAGNFGNGYVRDRFTDININTLHEFRSSVGESETIRLDASNQGQGRVMLSWSGLNQTPANSIDLDLFVYNNNGNLIAQSVQPQTGESNHVPLEIVQYDMSNPSNIQIRDASGNNQVGVEFVLFAEWSELPFEQGQFGSIIAPADSLNALTVGSQQGTQTAPYSSRGVTQEQVKPNVIAPGELRLFQVKDKAESW